MIDNSYLLNDIASYLCVIVTRTCKQIIRTDEKEPTLDIRIEFEKLDEYNADFIKTMKIKYSITIIGGRVGLYLSMLSYYKGYQLLNVYSVYNHMIVPVLTGATFEIKKTIFNIYEMGDFDDDEHKIFIYDCRVENKNTLACIKYKTYNRL